MLKTNNLMIKKSFTLICAAAAAAILLASCKKEPAGGQDQPEEPTEWLKELEGTKILEKSNAIGVVKDAAGTPLAGIPVTDGYSYVLTDENGVYQMEASRYARIIYLSVPAEFEIPQSEQHAPLFYSTKAFNKKNQNRNDFTLTKLAAPEEKFTLVMIGDPQCQNDSEVNRYKLETVPDIKAKLDNEASKYVNPYAVTLGDVTFDSFGTWEPMKKTMENVKLASGKYLNFFQCIGNHDHNSLTSGDDYEATQQFVNVFGPTDYSFDRAQTHIVVMDNVMATSRKSNSSPNKYTWNYGAGFTKQQLKWLEADLKLVSNKSSKMLVLCMHIPMRGGGSTGDGSNFNTDAYFSDVMAMMKDFKEAHIMIGHTHYSQNYIHTNVKTKSGHSVYEHIHGAACGGWWSCNSNATGGPNGYTVYEVDSNHMKNWMMMGTGRRTDYQMRVYDGNQIYNGSKGYELAWYNASQTAGTSMIPVRGYANLKNCLVAEIFDDDENWKVELYEDGVKKGDLKKVANGSCCNVAIAAYFFNELGKNTDTWSNRTCSHYWYINVGDPASYKNKKWEIRATQVIPDSGEVNTFAHASLTTDYGEF